ncbi:hypothetical protein [Micrococcus luteus]|uniref:hypothetical protein n=1 Tax=Micrococcus luteus TaxID=1270 RepID=UPI003D34B4ED
MDKDLAKLASEATGNVFVIKLGQTQDVGAYGPMYRWNDAINAIEATGWRLQHLTPIHDDERRAIAVFRRG